MTPPEPPGPTPWTTWMEIGLGHLRIRPADFWSMSLPEWRAAVTGHRESVTGERQPDEPMTRKGLMAMMEAHPDG